MHNKKEMYDEEKNCGEEKHWDEKKPCDEKKHWDEKKPCDEKNHWDEKKPCYEKNHWDEKKCICDGKELELAQAYVPFQKYDEMYTPEVGLINGTIFPELYRPYHEKACQCHEL